MIRTNFDVMITRFEIKLKEKLTRMKQMNKHSANIFGPNRLLPNKTIYKRKIQTKSAFPTGLSNHVHWVSKNGRKININ